MDNEQLNAKLVSYLEHLEKLTTSGEQFVLNKAPVYFQEYVSCILFESIYQAFCFLIALITLISFFEFVRRKIKEQAVKEDICFINIFSWAISGIINGLLFMGPFMYSVFTIIKCWCFPNVVIMEHLTSVIRSF